MDTLSYYYSLFTKLQNPIKEYEPPLINTSFNNRSTASSARFYFAPVLYSVLNPFRQDYYNLNPQLTPVKDNSDYAATYSLATDFLGKNIFSGQHPPVGFKYSDYLKLVLEFYNNCLVYQIYGSYSQSFLYDNSMQYNITRTERYTYYDSGGGIILDETTVNEYTSSNFFSMGSSYTKRHTGSYVDYVATIESKFTVEYYDRVETVDILNNLRFFYLKNKVEDLDVYTESTNYDEGYNDMTFTDKLTSSEVAIPLPAEPTISTRGVVAIDNTISRAIAKLKNLTLTELKAMHPKPTSWN